MDEPAACLGWRLNLSEHHFSQNQWFPSSADHLNRLGSFRKMHTPLWVSRRGPGSSWSESPGDWWAVRWRALGRLSCTDRPWWELRPQIRGTEHTSTEDPSPPIHSSLPSFIHHHQSTSHRLPSPGPKEGPERVVKDLLVTKHNGKTSENTQS